MPSPTFKSQEYWSQKLFGALVARAGLSDSSSTSLGKTICVALAACLDELSFNAQAILGIFSIDTAAGTDLDRRALDIIPGPLSRIQAQRAAASLTFTRGTSGAPVTIPAGSQVQTAAQVAFLTQADATIPAGQTFIAGVTALASVPGAAGNVDANTVQVFSTRPLGVDSVTNPAAATGGADAETDAAFRQRIRQYVAGIARGTPSAILAAVTGASDPATGDTILYASLAEDETRPGRSILYVADAAGAAAGAPTAVTGEVLTASRLGPPAGSAQGGEIMLSFANRPVAVEAPYSLSSSVRGALAAGTDYTLDEAAGAVTFATPLTQGEVITGSYSYFTGLIALAQKIVDGDPSNRMDYPGIRAAGTQVVVASPDIILEAVDATLTLDPSYAASDVQAAAQAAIAGTMQALPIGGNLLVAELVAAVMAVPGVVNVVFNTPASDVLATPNQLIRPPSPLSLIALH